MAHFLITSFFLTASLACFPSNSLNAACCPSQAPVDQDLKKEEQIPHPKSNSTGFSAGEYANPSSDFSNLASFVEDQWSLKLREKGVNLAASYYIELVGNPVGGKDQGFANATSLGCSVGLDLDKLLHISGLSLFSSAIYRSGSNLSTNKIDNQFPVAQLFGGETIRLNEIYLKETLFDGNVHLKAGHLSGGNDFLSSPLYCKFISNAFCGNPIAIFFNAPFLAYPYSNWGAYLDFKPSKKTLFKVAVYNDNLGIKANKYHGCNFTFKRTAGVLWMSEGVYLLNQTKVSKEYPGNYKVGGYYQTGRKLLFNGEQKQGNFGLYALFDQLLYRKYGSLSSEGLTLFGSFLFAPPNRNLFPYFFDLALLYTGLFTGCNRDSLSIGVAHGNYSSDLRAVQRQSNFSGNPTIYGNKPQSSETILELNYWYRFNKHFAVTPGLQYIINPKGYGTTPNALVLALQIGIDLIGLPAQ